MGRPALAPQFTQRRRVSRPSSSSGRQLADRRAELRIDNYLGFPDGVTGDQLAERARLQAQHFRAELLTARTVVGLEVRGPARQVMLDDGSSVLTHAVVLATGVSYRHLDATGAPELVGRGVYYGSSATQAESCGGDHVIIVGGANSAGQAAVFLSRYADKVTSGRTRRLASTSPCRRT